MIHGKENQPSLYVSQNKTGSLNEVIDLFTDSDSRGLAKEQGLSRRTVFSFHGLIFEVEEGASNNSQSNGARPIAAEHAQRMSRLLTPLFPTDGTHNSAMRCVYQWNRSGIQQATPTESPIRTLIVARLKPSDASNVANVFAESDSTDLPYQVGIDYRSLFVSDSPVPGDKEERSLYFHLVAAGQDITENLYRVRSTPLYQKIHTDLAGYVTPYDPGWKEPKDAMANTIYTWSA